MLPNKAIKEYQKLVKTHFKIDISLEKATEESNKLINLVKIIENNMNMENDYEQSNNT